VYLLHIYVKLANSLYHCLTIFLLEIMNLEILTQNFHQHMCPSMVYTASILLILFINDIVDDIHNREDRLSYSYI
jgi:hypothetical protein